MLEYENSEFPQRFPGSLTFRRKAQTIATVVGDSGSVVALIHTMGGDYMSYMHTHLLPVWGWGWGRKRARPCQICFGDPCSADGSLTGYLVCPGMGGSQGCRVFGDRLSQMAALFGMESLMAWNFIR